MGSDLVPISDEQAKLAGKAIDYIAAILGTLPQDIVGLMGGDWIRVKRAENMAKVIEEARERLRERGVESPQEVSLSLGIPLLRDSSDESREELVDLWSRLLAAAMDSTRSTRVRQGFLATIKGMDPIDALVLRYFEHPSEGGSHSLHSIARKFRVDSNQIELAFLNLFDLGCLIEPGTGPGLRPTVMLRPHLSTYGSELLIALRD
jgi:hypothetical protein